MNQNVERITLTEQVYYILLSLFTPNHGYGIMQHVREISGERVVLGPGTLYGAINTLVEKGWIEALEGEESSRKKAYVITPLGRRIVDQELERLKELLENGKAIRERSIS